jgi:hypothetical protein
MPAQAHAQSFPEASGTCTAARSAPALRRAAQPAALHCEHLADQQNLLLATLGLRLVRALLPVATLYVGKLIVDEVVRLAGLHLSDASLSAWWHSGELALLAGLLATEFALAVASDLLGRVVALVDSLLSELYSNRTSVRLMEHAAELDLEDFEDRTCRTDWTAHAARSPAAARC